MPPPRVSTGDRGMQCCDRYIRWCAENIQEKACRACQTGNKTECALLGLVRGLGRDYDKLRVVVKR